MTIRKITPSDAPQLFALTETGREYLRTWLPWVDKTTNISHTEAFIESSLHAMNDKKGETYVILEEDQVVGVISFNLIDWQNKTAYIGYWLGEMHQGKGLMTEAARTLVDRAFSTLAMHKVDIRAAEGNDKSQAIPKRLGFTAEGTLREVENVNGTYHNHVVYGMLQYEWQT